MTASDARPLCSVVIPSYNGRKLLGPCLESIRLHLPPSQSVEVIVADDASTDDTAAWIAETHPWVVHLRLATNQGFCGAANAGIAAARGDFVQLLNNDTEVLAGWIEAGLAPFADPSVGSVAPLVLVRSDPSRVDSAGDGYALMGWPFKRGHGESAEVWASRTPERVFGASGSSAFYRASALGKVGPYDASYGSYYEDVDLAFRLRWGGFDCVFQPASRILHDVSASYDHGRPALQRRMARNAELLFWSNLPSGRLLLSLLPHVGFTLLQALVRTLRGRGRPFLAGKWDALKLAPSLNRRRKLRADLAKSAIAPPRFPMRWLPFQEAKNHRRRPQEASSR